MTGALTQVGSFCPIRPNVVWALDFQFGTTACGRKLKLLKRHRRVHLRECPAILVDRGIDADGVVSRP